MVPSSIGQIMEFNFVAAPLPGGRTATADHPAGETAGNSTAPTAGRCDCTGRPARTHSDPKPPRPRPLIEPGGRGSCTGWDSRRWEWRGRGPAAGGWSPRGGRSPPGRGSAAAFRSAVVPAPHTKRNIIFYSLSASFTRYPELILLYKSNLTLCQSTVGTLSSTCKCAAVFLKLKVNWEEDPLNIK